MFLIALIVSTVIVLSLSVFYYRVHVYSWFIEFPKPVYHYEINENIMVPMHDGVKLATDIYRPNLNKKYPVIILRTPYDKSGNVHPYKQMALLFASQGYVFVVQDVRGRYLSEGIYEPYQNEGLDGYSTVEWAGQAEWSNGNVALYGFSYLGSCAWLTVPYNSSTLR